jgi:hypothetical protein
MENNFQIGNRIIFNSGDSDRYIGNIVRFFTVAEIELDILIMPDGRQRQSISDNIFMPTDQIQHYNENKNSSNKSFMPGGSKQKKRVIQNKRKTRKQRI